MKLSLSMIYQQYLQKLISAYLALLVLTIYLTWQHIINIIIIIILSLTLTELVCECVWMFVFMCVCITQLLMNVECYKLHAEMSHRNGF